MEIQLCGATGPLWAAAVMRAVGNRARAGTVLYGMESMTSIAEFKDRFEEGRRIHIAVPDDTAAAKTAAELDTRPGGVQLIELYGGFRPQGTAQVIKATGARVPIGAVYYSP